MIESKKLIRGITRPLPDKSSRSGLYRFDRNERTLNFDSREFNQMLSTLTSHDFVAYGELEPFYEKIAAWLNVERQQILLTSGSDAGIKAIFETFVESGDEVLNLTPNYAMFSVYSSMFGAVEKNGWYEKDLTLDADQFISLIQDQTKIVIIPNPGHTGSVIPKQDLIKIGEAASIKDAILIIDEAYHHFYPETMVDMISQLNNMIVVRTFSKAFGLASLRIGLLVGCKEIIEKVYRVKLVHEITGVAAKIGCFVLDNRKIMENYVNAVEQGKNILYEQLPKMGFSVLKSNANFIYFEYPEKFDAISFLAELEKKKIHIKGPFLNYPFYRHLRITVGDSVQMQFLCDTFNDIIQNRE